MSGSISEAMRRCGICVLMLLQATSAAAGVRGVARATPQAVAILIAENRQAMRNSARVGTLHARYAYSGQGLSGFALRMSDLATGYFVEGFSVGPSSAGSGYDGRTPWMRDFSGAHTPEEGGDRVPLAVNAAYRNGNLWWQPGFSGAAISYSGREISGGFAVDHLIITPKFGKRFDAWFDSRTHLLSRIAEQQQFFATQTYFAKYVRREGQLLPLVTTIDRGIGRANVETLRLRNVALTAALPSSAYARPTQAPAGASLANGALSITLPFRLLNNHLYIAGTVNGKGPFTFIVDTGGHTLLSPRLAAKIGLSSQGKAVSSGVGAKTAATGFTKVRKIAFGGVSMREQTAFVTTVYDTSIEGIAVDGMVGFELFRRFGVQINYCNRTLTFYDPKRFSPANAGTRIPFKFYDHLPEVEGKIDGLLARFDIDTGSRSELDVTAPFVRRAGLRARYPRGVTALTGWGVGGAVRSYVVRLPTLELGALVVREPVAELSDAKAGSFSDANYEGNIGTALLKRFVVTFDYAHQFMYLKPIIPTPADVGTFDRSGLWINAEPAGYIVTSVDKGGPAAQAGLAVGDIITAVDGRRSSMDGLSNARMSLRLLPPGSPVHLDFNRRRAHKAVDLKLRDLIQPPR